MPPALTFASSPSTGSTSTVVFAVRVARRSIPLESDFELEALFVTRCFPRRRGLCSWGGSGLGRNQPSVRQLGQREARRSTRSLHVGHSNDAGVTVVELEASSSLSVPPAA